MAGLDPQLKFAMGDHIRQMLTDRGWSQEQLAKATGIHPSKLSARLRGVNEFLAGELLAIAAAFDVNLDELFPQSPPPTAEFPLSALRLYELQDA